jgi:hypothetical protein
LSFDDGYAILASGEFQPAAVCQPNDRTELTPPDATSFDRSQSGPSSIVGHQKGDNLKHPKLVVSFVAPNDIPATSKFELSVVIW